MFENCKFIGRNKNERKKIKKDIIDRFLKVNRFYFKNHSSYKLYEIIKKYL